MDVPRRLCCGNTGFLPLPGGRVIVDDPGHSFISGVSNLLGCMHIRQLIDVHRVWYPTIQFTFKLHNPNTKETTWRSVNVTNFTTAPSGLDKRSCKADQFSITHKSAPGTDTPESYVLRGNLSEDFQISLDITRSASAPGWKVGKGPKGGFSYFGPDEKNPEGYVIHRFWPRTKATGMIILGGKATSVVGSGMFVHAIQGMRPNLVASRWNFANFQSDQHGGVSAVQMDFTTIDAYGRKGAGSGFVTVSVGSLVLGGKLVAVTAETKWPDEAYPEKSDVISRVVHSKTEHDPDTGYNAPTESIIRWVAPSLVAEAPGALDATLQVEYGSPAASKGLIQKVDVLAEIPYVIKTMVNYVAGTKPYIYQVCFTTKRIFIEVLTQYRHRSGKILQRFLSLVPMQSFPDYRKVSR